MSGRLYFCACLTLDPCDSLLPFNFEVRNGASCVFMEFQPVVLRNRTQTGSMFTDYDTMTEFYIDQTYRIAPKSLGYGTQVSSGTMKDITYKLNNAPDGFFVRACP